MNLLLFFLSKKLYLLNNIAENNTIGMTQFKSIKKPNIKLPIRAPPLPNVNDKAAAITLHVKRKKIKIKRKRISKLFGITVSQLLAHTSD